LAEASARRRRLEHDAAGWADVDAVLRALAAQGETSDWERLVRVVETNDKGRFELAADAASIRARQGHSVEVQADWTLAVPPEHLWHGTVDRFMASIVAEGLRPMARHHVHLSADVETAERVGRRRGKPVILVIEAGRLARNGQLFWVTGNGVWLTHAVPRDGLKVA
jgi:putative RNA 2'-phosphotransferase